MSRSPFAPPKKAPDPPAQRRLDYENILCRAISARRLVSLSYKHDRIMRVFQPSAVYHTTTGKVCVSGVQITNPAKPEDNLEPHNFEVGLVSSLSVTEHGFVSHDILDRSDKKYANGIICPI